MKNYKATIKKIKRANSGTGSLRMKMRAIARGKESKLSEAARLWLSNKGLSWGDRAK